MPNLILIFNFISFLEKRKKKNSWWIKDSKVKKKKKSVKVLEGNMGGFNTFLKIL